MPEYGRQPAQHGCPMCLRHLLIRRRKLKCMFSVALNNSNRYFSVFWPPCMVTSCSPDQNLRLYRLEMLLSSAGRYSSQGGNELSGEVARGEEGLGQKPVTIAEADRWETDISQGRLCRTDGLCTTPYSNCSYTQQAVHLVDLKDPTLDFISVHYSTKRPWVLLQTKHFSCHNLPASLLGL